MPHIILATNTIFIDLLRITLPKLHVKLQPHPLNIFLAKLEKVQKTHEFYIIMPTIPFYIISTSCPNLKSFRLLQNYSHYGKNTENTEKMTKSQT